MQINSLLAWFEIAASIATIGALIAVIYEIRKSRKIESRENIFETQKMWRELSETLKRERDMYWENFEDFRNKYAHGDQAGLRDFFDIMNFYEMISELVQLDVIDKDIMIRLWGQPLIFHYIRYKEIILGYRQEFSPKWYSAVDWLYEKAVEIYPEIIEGFTEFNNNVMENAKAKSTSN